MNSDCRAKTGSARIGTQDLVTTHFVTRAPGRPAKDKLCQQHMQSKFQETSVEFQ